MTSDRGLIAGRLRGFLASYGFGGSDGLRRWHEEKRVGRAIFWCGVVLLTISSATIPGVPLANEVDLSLSAGLNYAHREGLQAGVDIVSTYGPFGFLVFPCYFPQAGGWRLIINVALSFAAVVGLCLVAWRLRPSWRGLLLALYAWGTANVDWRIDLVVHTGLLCWALLCLVETGRRLRFCIMSFTLLAAFTALAKASFLVLASVTVIFLACDLLARSQWRLAAGMAAGFLAASASEWMVMGQNLSNIAAFLVNTFGVVQSYNEALGLEGSPMVSHKGILLLLLLVLAIMLRVCTAFSKNDKKGFLRLGLTGGWGLLIGLATWKHGFVHQDAGHVMNALGFVPVLAIGLQVLPIHHIAANRWAIGLALVCSLLAAGFLQTLYFRPLGDSLRMPFVSLAYNLKCILKPLDYANRMNALFEITRNADELPGLLKVIGRSTVDVFGQFQAAAINNQLNYRPRPIPQSYSACNRRLMRLNEEFYMGNHVPEFVLFDLKAMDERFAPLEDGAVLRYLLINYEPVAKEGRFHLLRSRGHKVPMLKLVKVGIVEPGQSIDLSKVSNTNLWMEIDLKPTLIGWLRQLVYRPPTVRLAAWTEPSGTLIVRRRAPAAMLANGFVISPLLSRNEDLPGVYSGSGVKRPGACTIELLRGEELFWKKAVSYRIYEIANRFGG